MVDVCGKCRQTYTIHGCDENDSHNSKKALFFNNSASVTSHDGKEHSGRGVHPEQIMRICCWTPILEGLKHTINHEAITCSWNSLWKNKRPCHGHPPYVPQTSYTLQWINMYPWKVPGFQQNGEVSMAILVYRNVSSAQVSLQEHRKDQL